jgi:DNA-binding transcriptional regulator YhcF (GntR family)
MADKYKQRGHFTMIPDPYFETDVYMNPNQNMLFLWLWKKKKYKPDRKTIDGKLVTIPVGSNTFTFTNLALRFNMNRNTVSKYFHQLEERGAIRMKFYRECVMITPIEFWNIDNSGAESLSTNVSTNVGTNVGNDLGSSVSTNVGTSIDSKDMEDSKDINTSESEEVFQYTDDMWEDP